jgi:hypothetical protein
MMFESGNKNGPIEAGRKDKLRKKRVSAGGILRKSRRLLPCLFQSSVFVSFKALRV